MAGSGLFIRFKIRLPVGPLAVIRLQIQSGIISGRGVTEIVFREAILLFPALFVTPGFQFRDRDVLLPMVGPVQLTLKVKKNDSTTKLMIRI